MDKSGSLSKEKLEQAFRLMQQGHIAPGMLMNQLGLKDFIEEFGQQCFGFAGNKYCEKCKRKVNYGIDSKSYPKDCPYYLEQVIDEKV